MKTSPFKNILSLVSFALILGFTISSCAEDTDGRPQIGPGTPKSAGIKPDSAAGGTVLTLTGTGLGDMRSIIFEKNNVPAGFQPTLNTGEAIIFRVPEDAAGGLQNIIFTNSAGAKLSVPFKVLAFPSVASVSNYNFTKDGEITIDGNNLDDVISVTLTGTTDKATIVSKTKKQLVVKMPASNVNSATLDIVNGTGLFKTTQEFVNLDKALQIFTEGYGEGFADGSWGDAGAVSTTQFKTGVKSVGKNYQKGNWHLINFTNWWPTVPYSADYKYLSVWIKGASEDYSLYITTDASKAGFGNFADSNKLNVKAGVWNYFKVKLSDIDFWSAGKSLQQLGFRIQGPDKQDEVFYFDDVILVK
jgi:hypothetical protein